MVSASDLFRARRIVAMVAVALCVATTVVRAESGRGSEPHHWTSQHATQVDKAPALHRERGPERAGPDARPHARDASPDASDAASPPRKQTLRKVADRPTQHFRIVEEPFVPDHGQRAASPYKASKVRIGEMNQVSSPTDARRTQQQRPRQPGDANPALRESKTADKGPRGPYPHRPGPATSARGHGSAADRDECVCDMQVFEGYALRPPSSQGSEKLRVGPPGCEPKCGDEVCKGRVRYVHRKGMPGRAPASALTRHESSGCQVRAAERSHVE